MPESLPPPADRRDRAWPDQIGHIGRYRILRKLGEGGMGRVYEAEQDSPRRIVALKVLRANFGTPQILKRFEHEAQALGRLHHPGIAQIFEAGNAGTATEPEPFFAMELVRGLSLSDYLADHPLAIKERLALFVKICEGVQHAHQNGVIHRDLKPANILVDAQGQPKILDFGLARLTDSDVQHVTLQTDIGQILGTLPYMSPEQVAADSHGLDTRSDVYALGVILYEMLSGQLPHDLKQKVLHEAVRTIREEEPLPLSAIDRVYRGDIETIVAKALEKEKERRYASASELATDIGRFLRDEPIVARKPSAMYQVQKFARRNRILVGGIAAVFVALLIGVIASTLFAVRAVEAEKQATTQLAATREAEKLARKSETEARVEAAKSKAVSRFLTDMLQAADPGISRDREVKVRDILDRAAKQVDAGAFKDQPEVEISLHETLGNTYSAIAELPSAEKELRAAYSALQALDSAKPVDVAACEYDLATALVDRGAIEEASRLVEKALETHRRLLGENSVEVANDLILLANVRYNQDKRDEILDLDRRAVTIYRALYGTRDPKIARTLTHLAFHLTEQRNYAEAQPLLDEAVDILQGAGVDEEPKLAQVLKQRGRLLQGISESQLAEQDFDRALEIYRRIYGDDHYFVADILSELASHFVTANETARAETAVRQALAIQRKTLGDHRDTATSIATLSDILAQKGDTNQALELANEALSMRRKLFGDNSTPVADSLFRLGGRHSDKGELAEAERLLRQSIEMFAKNLGDQHPDTARPMFTLARVLRKSGQLEEAEQLFRRCLELRSATQGELGSRTMEARDDLIQTLLEEKKWSETEALLREILPKYETTVGAGPAVAFLRIQLGVALAGQERLAEAEPLLVENAKVVIRNPKLWSVTKAMAADWVADFYAKAGMAEDEKQWREEAAKWKK